MAQETIDMSDAELDAMIANNPSEHETIDESGSGDDTNVSPLDDIDEGQTDENETVTDVGQTDELDDDPEDNLSSEEEESEVLDDEPEADDEPAEDNPDENTDETLEADNESIVFQPLRADGKEYPIESLQELYTLASKGINSNRKWEESAEGRRMQSTMKKNGIDMDSFNLLIEASKGDHNALLSLLNKNNIDPLDLDTDAFDGNYKPKDHSTNDFEIQLNDVVARVENQPRYQESVNVIMNDWDEASKNEFMQNPQILELLNRDMQLDKDGFSMYDKVSPLAEKLKALETGTRKTDLEYYMDAGKRVITAINQSNQSKADAKEAVKTKAKKKTASNNKRKKSAASSGGQSTTGKSVDVTAMTDEELDAFLDKTS